MDEMKRKKQQVVIILLRLPPARGSGERCKLPQRGTGRSLRKFGFWNILGPLGQIMFFFTQLQFAPQTGDYSATPEVRRSKPETRSLRVRPGKLATLIIRETRFCYTRHA